MSAWSKQEDDALRLHHGAMSIRELADMLGRSLGSVRWRVTELGLAKKVLWTEKELQVLRNAYEAAGPESPVHLKQLASSLGRSPANVCRKAKSLGLPVSGSRKIVAERKDRRVFGGNTADLKAHTSSRVKAYIAQNGHPRGALGLRHTSETKALISEKSKEAWSRLSDEERQKKVDKMYKGAMAAGGPPKSARGSWKAGWREIGGKRNFYRSRWEANYGRYLEWLKTNGVISDWAHEPETFWFEAIKRGTRSYKPDFRVWENNGNSSLHEVKGWMDARSKTCLARMAKYYPDQKIVLIDGPQYRAIRAKVMHMISGWEDSARDSHA